MALTATEEALLRDLLAKQAQLIALANNETTITAKLGSTKATLSDLLPASSVGDTDLFLTRQGTTDKSVTGEVLRNTLQTFLQDGTGAVVRPMNDKAKERVSVNDFGADEGATAAENTAAIALAVAALPAENGELYFTPGTYQITEAISITKPGTRIRGSGSKLVQTGILKQGLNITADRVEVCDLWLYNSRGGADWSNAGYTNAIAIYIGANYVTVKDCRIENWGSLGIRIGASGAGTRIVGNSIIGIGLSGGLIQGSNYNVGVEVLSTGAGEGSGVRIQGNRFAELAQGVTTADNLRNLSIQGNEFVYIHGQHAIYCDTVSNLSIVGNNISNTGYNGIKIQVTSLAVGDAIGISVIGNVISNVGDKGIVCDYASGTAFIRGIVISGNTVRDSASDGININRADHFSVIGNIIYSPGERGIVTNIYARNGIVSQNYIEASAATGLSLFAESAGYTVTAEGNCLHNCVTQDNGQVYLNSGVHLSTGRFLFRNNRVVWDGSPGAYYHKVILAFQSTIIAYENELLVSGYGSDLTGATAVNNSGPASYVKKSTTGTVTLDPRLDALTQEWNGVAANTTVQFGTSNAIKGDRFRIVKTDNVGAGTLTINLASNSKVIAANARGYGEVEFDGTAWVLTSYGSL